MAYPSLLAVARDPQDMVSPHGVVLKIWRFVGPPKSAWQNLQSCYHSACRLPLVNKNLSVYPLPIWSKWWKRVAQRWSSEASKGLMISLWRRLHASSFLNQAFRIYSITYPTPKASGGFMKWIFRKVPIWRLQGGSENSFGAFCFLTFLNYFLWRSLKMERRRRLCSKRNQCRFFWAFLSSQAGS